MYWPIKLQQLDEVLLELKKVQQSLGAMQVVIANLSGDQKIMAGELEKVLAAVSELQATVLDKVVDELEEIKVLIQAPTFDVAAAVAKIEEVKVSLAAEISGMSDKLAPAPIPAPPEPEVPADPAPPID